MPKEMAISSQFISFECSVVGRGGSRTALTGAVTMEQAGSTVGAGSARPSSPVVILLSQRACKPRPYKTCHLGSYLSITETNNLLSFLSEGNILYLCHTACYWAATKIYMLWESLSIPSPTSVFTGFSVRRYTKSY